MDGRVVVVTVDDRGSGSGSVDGGGNGMIGNVVAFLSKQYGRIRVRACIGRRFGYDRCTFVLVAAVTMDEGFFFHQEFFNTKE